MGKYGIRFSRKSRKGKRAIKNIVSKKTNDNKPPRGLPIISNITGIKKLAVSLGKISCTKSTKF